MDIDDALRERRSIRAFRPDPPPRALVEEILRYADESAPVNTLISEREPVEAFATFHGF